MHNFSHVILLCWRLIEVALAGMLGSKTATPHQLYASARTDKGCTEAQKMGMCTTLDNIKIVSTCKVVSSCLEISGYGSF